MSTPPGPQDPYGQMPSYGQPAGGGYGQPPAYGGGNNAGSPPPPNHLVWAIVTTVLCCLPLGIASIVFSTQVNSKWAQGDVAGAQASSAKAKKFAIASAIVGFIGIAAYVIFFVVLGANGMLEPTSSTSGF